MAIYLNGNQIDLCSKYSDGTYCLRLNRCIPESDIHIDGYAPGEQAYIVWKYHGEHEMPAIIYLAMHLREIGCEKMILSLPYIPNARLDRTKSVGEVFTLKYFARIINNLEFDSVQVLDPHSNVSCALLDRVVVRQPTDYIRRSLRCVEGETGEAPLLFYPDEGAMKRYSSLITAPYSFGIKKRDWETGKITSFEIHGADPAGKNILMVDDICSKGCTFYHSAVALKKAGAANIYIYVTHCENTVIDEDLLKGDLITHIYTTNSIFTGTDDKITVFGC